MINVLFVCVGNACRSQIAEGFLRYFSKKQNRSDIKVFSAGSSPFGMIPKNTQAVMAEIDIDISQQWSKAIYELEEKNFDYVISLCGDRCPYVPAEQHLDWAIPDPMGNTLESFRQVRDLIQARVENFLAELPPASN